jgi:hypothetical protein
MLLQSLNAVKFDSMAAQNRHYFPAASLPLRLWGQRLQQATPGI